MRRRARASRLPTTALINTHSTARLKWTEERRWAKKRYMDIDLLLEDLIHKAKEVKATKAKSV